jgi:hypothetical protein
VKLHSFGLLRGYVRECKRRREISEKTQSHEIKGRRTATMVRVLSTVQQEAYLNRSARVEETRRGQRQDELSIEVHDIPVKSWYYFGDGRGKERIWRSSQVIGIKQCGENDEKFTVQY